MGSFTSPSPAVDGVLLMRLSHFHAREICVWTGLIQANTRRHSSVCSYHGGCILVRSARLCVFSVELMWRKISDKQPVFSSQCQPSLSLHHTGPLYHTTDTMITSLSPLSSLSLSLSFGPALSSTYRHTIKPQKAGGFVWSDSFTNIDRLKPRLQCDKISYNHIYF